MAPRSLADYVAVASTVYAAAKIARCLMMMAKSDGGLTRVWKNEQSDARLRVERPAPNEAPHAHLLERYMLSSGGNLYLHQRQWMSKKPNGHAVVIVHGLTEHIGRYDGMAAALNAAGFDVFGIDLPGHGGSDGDRCFFQSIWDVTDDVLQHVREVSGPYGRKVLVIGHSLGALVASLAALKSPELFRGIVLSGPAVYMQAFFEPGRQFKWTAALMPKYLLSGGGEPPNLCRTEAVVQSYHLDPMCPTDGLPIGTFTRILEGMAYVTKNVGSFSPPLLLQHGTHDFAVSVEATEFMFAGVASTTKSKLLYEGWHHEPYNECAPECGVERDPATGVTTNRAVRDAIAWLTERASEP